MVSAFCRRSSSHCGAGIYVKDGLTTREISLFTNICEEKKFEMSLIELPMYKLNIVCIYRSPDRKLEKFLKKTRSSHPKTFKEKQNLATVW